MNVQRGSGEQLPLNFQQMQHSPVIDRRARNHQRTSSRLLLTMSTNSLLRSKRSSAASVGMGTPASTATRRSECSAKKPAQPPNSGARSLSDCQTPRATEVGERSSNVE